MIIEAKAILSAEDRTSKVLDGIAKKFKEVGKASKVSAEVDRMSKALGTARKHLAAIDDFRGAQGAFASARNRFRDTQAAVESAARAMAAAERPTRALQSALSNAQRAVSTASSAFEKQKEALIGAKRAVESFGTPITRISAQQAKLRTVIDGTTAGLARQAALDERRATRRHALSTAAAGAGVYAGAKTASLGARAITSAAEFDIGVRKQRVFTDLSEADQSRLLLPQAKRIGQETPFSNLDVVKAQTASMQGLPSGFSPTLKAEVAQGIVENVKNYAMIMETSLLKSAEDLRTYLQTTGKDISTGPKAVSASRLAVNQLVKMAKIGGMDADDVSQYMKYAGGSGTAAGLSSETMMSLAALARRGGLRGDEAGVFMRSTAGKLVSPTRQGLAALNAAGIDFNRYVSMPKSLDSGRLEGAFRNDLGKSFTPDVRKKLEPILSDPTLLGDRGRFTEAVTDAVASLFGKNKKGVMGAKDRQAIVRTAGRFHKVSAQSVDTERLLDDAMNKNMTLPQLNAWLTDKHGGKGAITQKQWDDFRASRQAIKSAGDDPDFAKKKSDEIMGGLGGSLENLKGSFDNLVTSIGTANEGIAKLSFDGLGKILDTLSNLPQPVLQAGTAIVALGAAATAAASTLKLLGAVFSFGKSSGGSGGKPGGPGIIGGTLGRVGTTVGAAGGATLGFGALAGLVATAIAAADEQFGHRPASGPGSRSYGRAVRADMDQRYGTSSGQGASVEAKLTGSAEVSGQANITVTVNVNASPELKADAQAAKSAAASLKGMLRAGGGGSGPGSTGASSPDASAGGTGSGSP